MQTVKAQTILDDCYRMIGWDADQLDTRDKADARMALSLALQEVWESWWWAELMQCQRVQFYPTWSADELPCGEGEVFYVSATDAYYLATETVGVAPTDADDNTNDGWQKIEPDTEYDLASGGTFEWNPAVPITRAGIECGPWGCVRMVSAHDPREQRHTETFESDPTESGEKILNLTAARPWVWSRRVTPVLTGDDYDASETYTAVATKDRVWVGDAESVADDLATGALIVTGSDNIPRYFRIQDGTGRLQMRASDGYWYDCTLVVDQGVTTFELGQTPYS